MGWVLLKIDDYLQLIKDKEDFSKSENAFADSLRELQEVIVENYFSYQLGNEVKFEDIPEYKTNEFLLDFNNLISLEIAEDIYNLKLFELKEGESDG